MVLKYLPTTVGKSSSTMEHLGMIHHPPVNVCIDLYNIDLEKTPCLAYLRSPHVFLIAFLCICHYPMPHIAWGPLMAWMGTSNAQGVSISHVDLQLVGG